MPQIINVPTMTTLTQTWQAWNRLYVSTTSATTSATTVNITVPPDGDPYTTAEVAWVAWNESYTHTISTSLVSTLQETCTTVSHDPWPAWNRQYVVTTSGGGGNGSVARIHQPTPEEVAAQQAQRIRARERMIQQEGERAQARARAARLLQENLDPAQRAELAAKGYFTIERLDTASGERRRYRINRGRSRNVQRVDDNGRVLRTLCAHPVIACPDEDTMLVQKLWLESGREQEFLQVANHS